MASKEKDKLNINYLTEAKPRAMAGDIPVFCAFDKLEPIAKLVPNPGNPNKHPESQIELLSQIIKAQGWRAPITVSTRSGFIVRGHGRLQAAQILGAKEVPVDYQNYASEAEEYADLIADNRIAELAEIDNKMLADMIGHIDTGEIPLELTGYLDSEYAEIIDALTDGIDDQLNGLDAEIEPPEEPVTKPGDLWILGGGATQGIMWRQHEPGRCGQAHGRRRSRPHSHRPAIQCELRGRNRQETHHQERPHEGRRLLQLPIRGLHANV
jgi:hypothetical protein